MAKQAKGKRRPIEVSCVAWADLLGYGTMLAETAFDPSKPKTSDAIQRLRAFQRVAVQGATSHFPAMPINDGVAYFTDLSARSDSVAADFLRRAIDTHFAINETDRGAGYPGARMVIAVGPRVRIGRPKRSDTHLRSIFQRLAEGQITVVQAIHEAFVTSPVAGFVPALQANFAFTRAYLANEAGSGAGLGGPNCYVDLGVFEKAVPDWIRFRRLQEWSARGLKVTFGELGSADWKAAGRSGFEGIASHETISKRLAGAG